MSSYNKPLSTDTNSVLFEGTYDPVGHQFVSKQAGTVTTDSAGNPSAPQMVQANDGSMVSVGSTTDAAYSSGSGTVIGVLKGIFSNIATVVSNTSSIVTNTGNVVTNTAHSNAKAGYVSFTTLPTATNAAADTTTTFSSQVNHWFIQNNTSVTVQFELDAAASAGSALIAAGGTWMSDVPVTSIHFYTATAQNLNGTASGNIVVKGWQ